jgi:hypothetical protein
LAAGALVHTSISLGCGTVVSVALPGLFGPQVADQVAFGLVSGALLSGRRRG